MLPLPACRKCPQLTRIVAGETRYKAAVSLGLTAAPVVTIPARQARAFRVIDNRTSERTSWDTDLLPDALSGLNDLDIFSFDDVLPLAVTAGKTDPDDIPETQKNPVTRTGDLWGLGKHRIVCGDSTDQKTVERLLDGAEPALMVTDPPYGVNYDASWRDGLGYAAGRARGASTNDDRCDRTDAYALFPGSIAYAWMSSLALPVAARGLDACGFIRRSLIIWDKARAKRAARPSMSTPTSSMPPARGPRRAAWSSKPRSSSSPAARRRTTRASSSPICGRRRGSFTRGLHSTAATSNLD